MLLRARDALHRFAEWLDPELTSAVEAARSRQLAPLRHVLQVSRFLHQRYLLDAVTESAKRPTDFTIEPDLPAGFQQLDVDVLGVYIAGLAKAADTLTPFEGRPFERKAIVLDRSAQGRARDRSSTPLPDEEQATLAALEGYAKQLVALLYVGVADLVEQAASIARQPQGSVDGDREMFTPPKLAKKWGVGVDKIYALIGDDRLDAVDVSKRRGGRPRYLISQKAVDDFLMKQQVEKSVAAPKKRRKSADDGVIEFF